MVHLLLSHCLRSWSGKSATTETAATDHSEAPQLPLVLGFGAQTVLATCKLLGILSCPAQGPGLRLDLPDFPRSSGLPSLPSQLFAQISEGIYRMELAVSLSVSTETLSL